MGAFTLRHFSNAQTLQTIQQHYLLMLLRKYTNYFRSRNLDLDTFQGRVSDYEDIARILMQPGDDTPEEFINDLYYVDEMATPEAMDTLLTTTSQIDIKLALTSDPTPADVAVQFRLLAPEVLERKHAEHSLLQRRRSFEYFQTNGDTDTEFRPPDAEKVRTLENDLGARLEVMKRGRSCKVFIFQRADGVWFLVRRGDPFKREGTIEKEGASSVYYRPEKYDVLKYDEHVGELCINTDGNKKLVELYKEKFGEHLFGNPAQFPNTAKYTLDPLLQYGADALICTDVEGIDWIRLKEVQIYWGGPEGELEIRRARDLFAAMKARQREFPSKARLVRASFSVKFTDAKTPRTVTIRPQNIASYTRDSDADAVEAWLLRRGFVIDRPEAPDARPSPLVAHT